MGTRCNIGLIEKNENGVEEVEFIYNHWDGYPNYVGKILFHHYNTEEKIKELLSYGAVSSLGSKIGVKHDFDNCPEDTCNFYGRDREEEGISTKKVEYNKENLSNISEWVSYTYIFKENKWYIVEKEYEKENWEKYKIVENLLTESMINGEEY